MYLQSIITYMQSAICRIIHFRTKRPELNEIVRKHKESSIKFFTFVAVKISRLRK